MSVKFDVPISVDTAYRLLCTMSVDEGARDSISARGWINHASNMSGERAPLTDSSYIYRDFVSGRLYRSNESLDDVLASFNLTQDSI
jgi:hypothetical protein